MKSFGFLFVIVVFVGILKLLIELAENAAKSGPRDQFPYIKGQPLFSPAERSFLGVLEHAVGAEYRIYAKARLGDVIQPKKGLTKSAFATALNKVNRKHVDFVICRKNDCEVLGVIELDDRSHQREDRRKRDQFVDMALEAAGIPILHFSAKMSYPVNDIRTSLVNAFSLQVNGVGQNSSQESTFHAIKEEEEEPQAEWTLGSIDKVGHKKEESNLEMCPDCGALMRSKKVSKGPHMGKCFFVCSSYPKCKGIKRVVPQMT